MTSPEWPKWQFRDGRKRMTLPIVDGKGEKGEGDLPTPQPIRLNSTESALKKTKSEGEKVSCTSISSASRRRKSSKAEGGEWMSKEATQREIRARRSIDSLASTVPDQRSINSRPEPLTDTVFDQRSIKPDTLLDTVPDRMPTNSPQGTLGDNVLDRRSTNLRSETVPDTVPENRSTVGERASIDFKIRSSTPLSALENVTRELKKGKEKPSHLPDPLSKLMLEREKSIRREGKIKKRRGEHNESNMVTTTAKADCSMEYGEDECIPRPSEPRKHSLFYPSNKPVLPQRRASLESTVALPDWSIVESETDTVADCRKKSTVPRRTSISSFGGKRDGHSVANVYKGTGKMELGEGEKKRRLSRRFTEGVIDNWAKPSLHDFRPSLKQAKVRGSTEAANEKETTVVVRRESTSVVPATPMGSEKEGEGERRASLISPSSTDFVPLQGRKKNVTSAFFGKKTIDNEGEGEGRMKVKPVTQLSWGRLASAIYRKTSMRSEVSIGSTIPGEFEEEEVELERERERMNSITSQNSDTSETELKKPVVNRFLSSISLATTRGPSDVSVVKDSLEEEEEPNNSFKPLIIEDESPPDEFEIKDTLQDGAPKELKFTKQRGLGLFRRPVAPPSEGRPASLSPPPPSRQSSGGSTAAANPRGRRQYVAGAYENKLSKQLEKTLNLRRSDRTLLKHDNSSVTSAVLAVEEDRSSGWGVSLFAHSRGYILLPGNTAPAEGSCVRVALPLQRVLESVAVAPTVL